MQALHPTIQCEESYGKIELFVQIKNLCKKIFDEYYS